MKIFFSVGEPSGDLHGANLIRSLRKRHPGVKCSGLGGPRMREAGCDLHTDLTELAIMGFIPVVVHIVKFYKLLQEVDQLLKEQQPDAVVLIDYPGFNWWVARKAKKYGIPVFYYGVPQMWAWAAWRIGKMRRLVDHVLCKLPFEADWYNERGCHATYVGHPYFDELRERQLDYDFIHEVSDYDGDLVTILPGSRSNEVRDNLNQFLNAAERIQLQHPETRFAVASFSEKHAAYAEELAADKDLQIQVFHGRTPELIEAAKCCLACSGSVSLELLYHQKPSVILYQVKRLGYKIATKFFMRVRYITLVNLLACPDRFEMGKGVYDPLAESDTDVPLPEYLTYEDRTNEIANHVCSWLEDDEMYEQYSSQLSRIRNEVAHGGASETAAEYMLEALLPAQERRAA